MAAEREGTDTSLTRPLGPQEHQGPPPTAGSAGGNPRVSHSCRVAGPEERHLLHRAAGTQHWGTQHQGPDTCLASKELEQQSVA